MQQVDRPLLAAGADEFGTREVFGEITHLPRTLAADPKVDWLKSGPAACGGDRRASVEGRRPIWRTRVQDMIYRGESLLKGFKKRKPSPGWRGLGLSLE